MRTSRSAKIFLAISMLTVSAMAAPPITFQPGQSIEVREGDSWSGASVVKKEGRKYLVHYLGADASTDEWVTTDRMRLPGDSAPVAPAVPVVPAEPVKPSTPGPPKFKDPFGPADEVIPQTLPSQDPADVNQPTGTVPWAVVADPAAKSESAEAWTLHTHSTDTKAEIRQLLPCTDGGAVIGYAYFDEKVRRIERIGTKLPSLRCTIPPQCMPLAASPSGGLLVCRSNAFGFGNSARIDAFSLSDGSAATPLVSFTPYPSHEEHQTADDIKFAVALSDTRIITGDGKGRVTAWDIAANSVKGIWHVDFGLQPVAGFQTNAMLTPGNKYLAVANKGSITFLETATGHTAGIIDTWDDTMQEITFSPSGKTLIGNGVDSGTLVSFDAATGLEIRTVAMPAKAFGPMTCVDEGYALIDGRTLIDTNTGAVVIRYPSFEGMILAANGPGITVLASNTKLQLMHLPDAATKKAAAAAAESSLALKPGMNVSLDIQVDLPDADKTAVETAIRKKLKDDGFVIADSADTVVVVRTEQGQQHEHVYAKNQGHMPVFMAMVGQGTSIILTDKVTRITINQKGNPIWERKHVSSPAPTFRLKDNQSLEDGAKETIQYDPNFLITVVIPPYIAGPQPDDKPLLQPTPRTHKVRE